MNPEPRFDEVIHAPVRLRICGLLASADAMEFAYVREQLGVADSVVSKHVSRLVADGYLTVLKGSRKGHVRTWLKLTPEGREAFAGHVAALQEIARGEGLGAG